MGFYRSPAEEGRVFFGHQQGCLKMVFPSIFHNCFDDVVLYMKLGEEDVGSEKNVEMSRGCGQ